MKLQSLLCIGLFTASLPAVLGQPAASPAGGPPSAPHMELAKFDPSKTPVKQISPGVYDVRGIRLIKSDRSVSFPAVVNLIDAPQEYFLVSQFGASHESIFRTKINPIDLHVAMLLLGAKGAPLVDSNKAAVAEPARNPYEGKISGDEVELVVSWQNDAGGLSVSAGSVTLSMLSGKEAPLVNAKWIYNGSRLHDGMYMAQVNGNFVSLIADEFAMINYQGPGSENDDIWRANTALLPKTETPVTVTIRLASPKK